MNKSEIRKKILKIRKNSSTNLNLNFYNILKILKKNKSVGKIIGGYYPHNHEINPLNILEKLELQEIF